MAETFTSGDARIDLDQREVVRLLDRTTKGAATGFIREADDALGEVEGDAIARWPVATGRSKGAFERTVDVQADRIDVVLANTAHNERGKPYPRFLRFSVFSTATVQADLRDREEFASRGKTPEAQAELRTYYDRTKRLTTSEGEDDPKLQGRPTWSRLVRTPARRAGKRLVDAVRDDLARLAGGS